MGKIQVWGTSENGQGMTQNLGLYDNIQGVIIHVGALSDDVVITFQEVN